MAGFMKVSNKQYIGTIKLADNNPDIKNGTFVSIDWATATASSTPLVNTVIPYFVENVLDCVDEEVLYSFSTKSELDFVISENEYLRLHRVLPGEIFVTTEYVGAAASYTVGDNLCIYSDGTLCPTAGSPAQTFVLKEKASLWGTTAFVCVALDE
jgi:hypothetical protein